MQKVLVAEIGRSATIVKAFAEMNSENPRFLGQGVSGKIPGEGSLRISLEQAVEDLENDIGLLRPITEIPFYLVSSIGEVNNAEMQEIKRLAKYRIAATTEAMKLAAFRIFEEVGGDLLIINVGENSIDLYLIFQDNNINQAASLTPVCLTQSNPDGGLGIYDNALALVKHIGEDKIIERHGRDWQRFLKGRPETPEEIALSAELIAVAIQVALQRLNGHYQDYLEETDREKDIEKGGASRVRWIVGTGEVLLNLPNALDVMSYSVGAAGDTKLHLDGPAFLLDKDCLISSLGVLAQSFRPAVWQLLRESLGVEN